MKGDDYYPDWLPDGDGDDYPDWLPDEDDWLQEDEEYIELMY